MDLGRKSEKLRVLEEVQENYANGFMESAMPRLLSDMAGAEWERCRENGRKSWRSS